MCKKFIRKYGLTVVFSVALFGAFSAGFLVGRGNEKEIPVFVEVPTPVVIYDDCEQQDEQESTEPTYKTVEVKATAYCACEKCCGVWATKRPKDENGDPIVYTATGAVATAGRTIAADPTVFPYGTVLEINGTEYVVEDCGGAIKGNRIDVYFDSHEAARQFGVQNLVAVVKESEAEK